MSPEPHLGRTPMAPKQIALSMPPVMPKGFYGRVVYEYQDGKLVMIDINEKIKP